jgi:hypothetical protein
VPGSGWDGHTTISGNFNSMSVTRLVIFVPPGTDLHCGRQPNWATSQCFYACGRGRAARPVRCLETAARWLLLQEALSSPIRDLISQSRTRIGRASAWECKFQIDVVNGVGDLLFPTGRHISYNRVEPGETVVFIDGEEDVSLEPAERNQIQGVQVSVVRVLFEDGPSFWFLPRGRTVCGGYFMRSPDDRTHANRQLANLSNVKPVARKNPAQH